MPPEVQVLIQKFLASGGKDRGEFGKSTPRYPDAKYDQMEEALENQLAQEREDAERSYEAQEMGGHHPKG